MALNRVLEPEVMDTLEEAQDYDSMNHQHVNQLFVKDVLDFGITKGDLLDLGTGTAQIPVHFCLTCPDVRIMAVDMAVNMLDLARYNIEVAGVTERVQLAQCDAKDLPQSDATFDAVISNSIVHHIPDPMICLSEAVRVTKAGGRLFIRDLMRPDTEAELEAFVETYAGDENEHQQKMFRESLHAALSLAEIREGVASLGFESDTVQATSDRHWTWAAIKP
jgi:ubiquinone/menaquinone biosynthesis C-methylase UbiE